MRSEKILLFWGLLNCWRLVDQIMPILHFLFLEFAHVIDQKKYMHVSSIIYSLGLNNNMTSLSHVLYYASTFKFKQYMQDDWRINLV